MNVVVFGATGRTGIPLVEQALAGGDRVKAFVRTPSKLKITHDNLEIVQGDILDAAAVEKAVEGTDAVLCVIGHTKNSPDDLQTHAMRAVTDAMKKHNVKRLVDLTGAGVRDTEDQPKLFDRLIVFALSILSPKVLEDGKGHVAVIRDSGLEWTVVRAPMLQDGAHTGKYRVGYVGKNSGSKISRADVADFMLKEARERNYIGKLPMISY
ncbi:MAG: NAD(P)H-binding protein [Chitinivibrionales bacterium]|nr:NAD(P)H-binding protein [Chitinivibrionales bacterium]